MGFLHNFLPLCPPNIKAKCFSGQMNTFAAFQMWRHFLSPLRDGEKSKRQVTPPRTSQNASVDLRSHLRRKRHLFPTRSYQNFFSSVNQVLFWSGNPSANCMKLLPMTLQHYRSQSSLSLPSGGGVGCPGRSGCQSWPGRGVPGARRAWHAAGAR